MTNDCRGNVSALGSNFPRTQVDPEWWLHKPAFWQPGYVADNEAQMELIFEKAENQ